MILKGNINLLFVIFGLKPLITSIIYLLTRQASQSHAICTFSTAQSLPYHYAHFYDSVSVFFKSETSLVVLKEKCSCVCVCPNNKPSPTMYQHPTVKSNCLSL